MPGMPEGAGFAPEEEAGMLAMSAGRKGRSRLRGGRRGDVVDIDVDDGEDSCGGRGEVDEEEDDDDDEEESEGRGGTATRGDAVVGGVRGLKPTSNRSLPAAAAAAGC